MTCWNELARWSWVGMYTYIGACNQSPSSGWRCCIVGGYSILLKKLALMKLVKLRDIGIYWQIMIRVLSFFCSHSLSESPVNGIFPSGCMSSSHQFVFAVFIYTGAAHDRCTHVTSIAVWVVNFKFTKVKYESWWKWGMDWVMRHVHAQCMELIRVTWKEGAN